MKRRGLAERRTPGVIRGPFSIAASGLERTKKSHFSPAAGETSDASQNVSATAVCNA
jgi:hypothetical protein